MGKVPTDAPHCVVCLKVSLMVSALTQPKYGLYLSKSVFLALVCVYKPDWVIWMVIRPWEGVVVHQLEMTMC